MELSETLRLHSLWMSGESEGVRADLQGANLTRANLQEADLTYANLEGANLKVANLEEADLTCANLTNANLTRANLTRADLTGVNWGDPSITSVMPPLQVFGLQYPILILDRHAKIGCKMRLITEWVAMTAEEAEEKFGARDLWECRDALLAFIAENGRV